MSANLSNRNFMKILITVDFPPEIGGIQQYLYDQVLHHYTRDDIVINGSSQQYAEQLHHLPCKVIQISWFSFLNKKLNLIPILFLLIIYLYKNKQVAMESGNIYGAIPAYLLSHIYRKLTYSVYCYGSELLQLQKHTLKAAILKAVIRKASQRITISSFTCTLLDKAGVKGAYSLQPPKIDLSSLKKEPNQADKNGFNILTIGRFVKHKGHSVLLDAVAALPDSIPWKVTIAGDGPLYQQLLQMSVRSPNKNRVSIVKNPSRSEIIDLYKNADLFIFPSLELPDSVEGFGIVLLEAMAFRIPVIASQTGGIIDVVNSDCAVLVPPGDPDTLKNAIISLFEQPHLRNQLSQQALERVRSTFSWN